MSIKLISEEFSHPISNNTWCSPAVNAGDVRGDGVHTLSASLFEVLSVTVLKHLYARRRLYT